MKIGTPGPHFHYEFGDPLMKSGTPLSRMCPRVRAVATQQPSTWVTLYIYTAETILIVAYLQLQCHSAMECNCSMTLTLIYEETSAWMFQWQNIPSLSCTTQASRSGYQEKRGGVCILCMSAARSGQWQDDCLWWVQWVVPLALPPGEWAVAVLFSYYILYTIYCIVLYETSVLESCMGVPIFMRGSPISYENWAPGVPKIILTWGPGIWNWGPGVPKIGGPQSHMTPVPVL